jgi:hypothetical protein
VLVKWIEWQVVNQQPQMDKNQLFFHLLASYWIAAHYSSNPPITTIKSNSLPTACPIYGCQNAQPLQIHPEDDNCKVC